ncbi:MAG: hypothetical protein KUG68_08345, partial [Flavobacteriaceae bacterium]|nr:hypothetical protein [Flavobacteriaceae bacterium]
LLLPLSYFEFNYFNTNFPDKTSFLPVFHGNEKVDQLDGNGNYALYHGDLTTSDNVKSVRFLISIFSELNFPFYIAGSKISSSLKKEISHYNNIHFEALGEDNLILDELLKNAQINILHSNQQSGTKLKVFNSLFKGRHCIVNKNITDDDKLLSLCYVAETKEEYIEAIKNCFNKDYILDQKRKDLLLDYSPIKLAEKLIDLLNQKL